jgi:hypothetical protein
MSNKTDYQKAFSDLLGVDLVGKVKALALKFSGEEIVVAPVAPIEVKLTDVPLKDGTMLQVDKMEVGGMANVVTADGVTPAPDAEYVAEDGTVITVMGGLIAEIATAEVEVEVPEEAPIVAGINSQLEAVAKRLNDIEAKFSAQTIELNETKKGLGIALSSVEKLVSQPVAISLEKQKPSKKVVKTYEEMTNHEKMLFNKGKL